ncbi:MAG: rRNA ((1402)-2-O)-methyltransferase [Pseudomonadota bacterium]
MSSPALWLQAAVQAAGLQHYPASALYVVATPIGNLADITLRAIHVLGLVDAVACEDTRVSAGLLQRIGLHKPLLAVHEHNEGSAATGIIARLQAGERIACISDAGTPAVSDPGARLVAAVRAAGLRVVPVPGASSVVTALSAAGDVEAAGFAFHGFLPAKGAVRAAALARAVAEPLACVLFEAPHRIEALADALASACPTRRISLCRELTKQFEQIDTLDCVALPAWLAADADRRRGEFALVLHAPPRLEAEEDAALDPQVETLLLALLEVRPLRQAVDLVAEACRQPRKPIYQRALAWKAAQDEADDTDADSRSA